MFIVNLILSIRNKKIKDRYYKKICKHLNLNVRLITETVLGKSNNKFYKKELEPGAFSDKQFCKSLWACNFLISNIEC